MQEKEEEEKNMIDKIKRITTLLVRLITHNEHRLESMNRTRDVKYLMFY